MRIHYFQHLWETIVAVIVYAASKNVTSQCSLIDWVATASELQRLSKIMYGNVGATDGKVDPQALVDKYACTDDCITAIERIFHGEGQTFLVGEEILCEQ